MTLRQAVSDLRAMIKQISSDSLLSDRTIASELRSAAAFLIRRDLRLRRLWSSPTIFDTIRCLQLCEVPLAECCSYVTPCTIRKSVCRISGIADAGTYGLVIQGVFSIDGRKKFKEASPSRFENLLRLNLVDRNNYFWILDGFLYITDPDVEAINLIAYFEEGVQLIGQGCQCDNSAESPDCSNPLDKDFKCPTYLVDSVKSIVYDKLMRVYKASVADPVSDEKDDSR